MISFTEEEKALLEDAVEHYIYAGLVIEGTGRVIDSIQVKLTNTTT